MAALLIVSLVPALAMAERRAGRQRQFVPANELQKAYPGVEFHGDVRVERGAVIDKGSVLRQTGTKPLYILSGTQIAGSGIAQSGNRPLIITRSEIVGSNIGGNGVLAKSVLVQTYAVPTGGKIGNSHLQLAAVKGPFSILGSSVTGGVVRGMARVRHADVYGIVSGSFDQPIQLSGLTLEPLQAHAPASFKVTFTPPPKQFSGPGVLQVHDAQGQPAGAQMIDVKWNPKAGTHGLDPSQPLEIRGVVTEGFDLKK